MTSAPYGDDEQSRRVPPATTYVMADFAWRDPDGRPWDAGEHTHYSGPVVWHDPVGGVDGGPGPDGMPTGMVDPYSYLAGDFSIRIASTPAAPGDVSPFSDERWTVETVIDELGEMFVTALTFLWIGSGALVYLLVGLFMIAVVVVVAPPVRLYLLARNVWRRSKPRSHGEFGDWNPW
jgi:hypothetical protein